MMVLHKNVWSWNGALQVHARTCKTFKVGSPSLHCIGKQTQEHANNQIKLKLHLNANAVVFDLEYHLDVRNAFGDVRASRASKHWQLSFCAKLQLCFTNLQQVSAVGQKKVLYQALKWQV